MQVDAACSSLELLIEDLDRGYKCQLSVKILVICQLSVKFKAICQLSVNLLLINNQVI